MEIESTTDFHKIYYYRKDCELISTETVRNNKGKEPISPLTHVKDKKAEGAKDDGSDLLPVN